MPAERVTIACATGVAGAVLLYLGLFDPRSPEALGLVDGWRAPSPVFDAGSDDAAVFEEALRAVERAANRGDVMRLERLLTPRYFDLLEARRAALGAKPLDGFALHEIASLIGGLDRLVFRQGRSDDRSAVVVYEVRGAEGPVTGGHPARWRAQAFRFVWDPDGTVRLDDKRARWFEREDDGGESALRTWALGLLASR